MRLRVRKAAFRVVRRALIQWARGGRRDGDGRRRITILLVSPWGMGGTIRTVLNVSGYLAAHGWDVEILGTYRRRNAPFFGDFPPGVKVIALDDQRGKANPVVRRLRGMRSVLLNRSDRLFDAHSLLTDIRLARALRGRTGFLMGTRPALNLLAAQLAQPGLVAIGQEHVNYRKNSPPLRRAIASRYPALDALVVLTEDDERSYSELFGGALEVVAIPNAVPELGGGLADLGSKRVIAAGRVRYQKGFDLLVEAWAQVAGAFPDWRLHIYGTGPERAKVEALIEEHALHDSVVLEERAQRLGDEMEAASVYALSSRFEGFPMILLEAMTKGMAVVSFDCPTGPGAVIDDGRNGRIVPKLDVDAFAAALRDVLGDEDLRRRCAAAAVETAAGYRMDAIGRHWDELLERHAASLS